MRQKVERNISYDDVRMVYYVNFDYGKDENGTRIKKTATFKTKSEAQKALKLFEADKIKGAIVSPRETLLCEWLENWMRDVVRPNRAATTVYAYQQMIDNHINPALGKIPLQKLSPQQIQKYYTAKLTSTSPKLSPNTVRKHHDLLNSVLKYAVKQDVLLRNPAERVIAPTTTFTEKGFYTVDQLRELFRIVEGDRLEVVVKLAGYLGLRREEICGLRWRSVELDACRIVIRDATTMAGSKIVEKDTKNASSARVLYIPTDLRDLLANVKAKQASQMHDLQDAYCTNDLVVCWPDGRPYRPNYISELFTKLICDNDLPKIVLHELRHTFATIANSLNVSLFDIGKALGHSSPSITGRVYTHLTDQTHESTISSVAKAIGQQENNPE